MVQKSSAAATAPSTSANMGPGFDVFGIALSAFHDKVKIRKLASRGIHVDIRNPFRETIPQETARNTAAYAAANVLRRNRVKHGVQIMVEKRVPIGRGLGSSAASSAACVAALNALFELGLSENQMVEFAAQGEKAAAGVAHADNAAAAVLGGFTIVRSYHPLDIIKLDPPRNLGIVVAIPDIPVAEEKTKAARRILPKKIPLEKAVHNIGHASTMVAGIALKNVGLLGRGISDMIVEPVRAKLVPGYSQVKRNALQAGAVGVAISGAGPTMIAFFDTRRRNGVSIGIAMKKGMRLAGVASQTVICRVAEGAQVIKVE